MYDKRTIENIKKNNPAKFLELLPDYFLGNITDYFNKNLLDNNLSDVVESQNNEIAKKLSEPINLTKMLKGFVLYIAGYNLWNYFNKHKY